MRPLNDYFIDGEGITDIGTDGNTAQEVCVPEAGELVGIAAGVQAAATTVETTFNVFLNGVDLLVDALLPIMAVNTGTVMTFDGTVNVEVGDGIVIRSNGETGNAPNLHITWIIRR
jgi:hypothetical protein